MAGNWQRVRDGGLVVAALALATATTARLLTATAMSSYGTASAALLVADLAAGGALIASGSWSIVAGRRRRLGTVVLWLGMSWLSADWMGSSAGDGWVRIAAIALTAIFGVLLLHSALTLLGGESDVARARIALTASYVVVVALALLYAVVNDPFTDPDCWRTCQHNPHLLLNSPGVGDALGVVLISGQLVSALLATVIALRWMARGTRRSRLVLGPVAVPIPLVSLAYSAAILMDWFMASESPDVREFTIAYGVQAVGLVALAVSPFWSMRREASMRRAVHKLTHPVGEAPSPESLAVLLREALSDPTLTVAYPVGSDGHLVDAEGRSFTSPTATPTALLRGDRVIAYVYHEPRPGDGPLTAQQLGAAAQLAVDNERLRAELLAQVEELRASQALVIEASDTARRQLERDLHDGAQQRVLALLFELQRAREMAAASGTADAETLVAACHEAESALAELRDIAHGIFPAILDDAGLAAAIETLRDVVDVPVVVEQLPDDRFAPAVERAAYAIVAGVLNASTGASTTPRIALWQSDGSLMVSIDGLTEGLTDDSFERMATRVEALRGDLQRGPDEVRAVIPCA